MTAVKNIRIGSFPGLRIRKSGSSAGTLTHDLPNGTDYIKTSIAVRVLTAAETKALFTTPISLVAAPGAGLVAFPIEIVAKNVFGTAAYTGGNALEFRYTDASGTKVTADIASTFINLASGTQYNRVGGVAADTVLTANAALVVRVPTANPAAGDGIITITVHYRIFAV